MSTKYHDSYANPENFTVQPMAQNATIFGHTVSDLQADNVFLGNGQGVGTLKKVTSGALAAGWGEGHFMALQFGGKAFDECNAIYVGMEPSVSSGLVNIKNDPDRNGAFKVTNDVQRFKVILDYGSYALPYLYDLSGMSLSNS